MGELIHDQRMAQRRASVMAQEWERNELAHLEAVKCCAFLHTPDENQGEQDHVCLRKKNHKGYHHCRDTGLSWRWDDEKETQ